MSPLKASNTTKTKEKERLFLLSAITTFCSLMPTLLVTLRSNSIVLMADLCRSVVEFLAILMAYLIIRGAKRADTTRFNYGFGKFEHLSSIGVAAAMLIGFLLLFSTALYHIWVPAEVTNYGWGLLLAAASVGGNAFMWLWHASVQRRQPSAMSHAQTHLFRSKAFASLVVVVSLGTLYLPGIPHSFALYADPVGGIVVAGFLLYSAVGLFSSSIHDLADGTLEEALQLLVLRTLVKYEADYKGLRSIRSRRVGSKIYIQLFLIFEGNLRLEQVNKVSTAIEGAIQSDIPSCEVTIVPSSEW